MKRNFGIPLSSRPALGGSNMPTGSRDADTQPGVTTLPPAGAYVASRRLTEGSVPLFSSDDIRETAVSGFLCLCAVAFGCALGLMIFSVSLVFEREPIAKLVQYERSEFGRR